MPPEPGNSKLTAGAGIASEGVRVWQWGWVAVEGEESLVASWG